MADLLGAAQAMLEAIEACPGLLPYSPIALAVQPLREAIDDEILARTRWIVTYPDGAELGHRSLGLAEQTADDEQSCGGTVTIHAEPRDTGGMYVAPYAWSGTPMGAEELRDIIRQQQPKP